MFTASGGPTPYPILIHRWRPVPHAGPPPIMLAQTALGGRGLASKMSGMDNDLVFRIVVVGVGTLPVLFTALAVFGH